MKLALVVGGLYKQEGRRYAKELVGIKDGFDICVLDELCRVMKKINIYFFCSQKQIIKLLDYFVKIKKCNWNILSWHKTNPVPACGNKYLTDTEYVLFFREKGVKVYGTYETKKTYWTTPLNVNDKKMYKHPTIKPEHIVKNLVINSSQPNEVVLDCFMGTGTTGAVCVSENRNFIGIEINDEYFNVAKNRIDNVSKSMTN